MNGRASAAGPLEARRGAARRGADPTPRTKPARPLESSYSESVGRGDATDDAELLISPRLAGAERVSESPLFELWLAGEICECEEKLGELRCLRDLENIVTVVSVPRNYQMSESDLTTLRDCLKLTEREPEIWEGRGESVRELEELIENVPHPLLIYFDQKLIDGLQDIVSAAQIKRRLAEVSVLLSIERMMRADRRREKLVDGLKEMQQEFRQHLDEYQTLHSHRSEEEWMRDPSYLMTLGELAATELALSVI